MWKKTYSKTFSGIKREDVWRIWTDVNQWTSWHSDLERCTLEGRFAVGNHFFLTPKSAKPIKIQLIDIQEGHAFTDCTSFLGAKMLDTHAMEESKEGLILTNTLVVTGPLKWLWIKRVAEHVSESVPAEMEALVARAKRLYA